MKNENVEVIGNVNMSDEVIAIVSGVAATGVTGVKGMCNTLSGGIAEFLGGKKSFSRGVKVEVNGDDVKITACIIVEYGCKIPEVAWEVQERVKREVESMTSLNVTSVDVYVNGISLEQPAAEKKEENK